MKTAAEVRSILQETKLRDKQEEIKRIVDDILAKGGKTRTSINPENMEEIVFFFKSNGYKIECVNTRLCVYEIDALN